MKFINRYKTYSKRKKIIVIAAMVIAILCCNVAIFAHSFASNMMGNIEKDTTLETEDLSCVNTDGYVNIALFGVDSRDMSQEGLKNANTDCIIVVSYNPENKNVNLVSVYRDTFMKIGDTDTYDKVNSAYATGGAQTAIKTLNQSMDLDIQNYVMFNFKMVADLVDCVGGIDVNIEDYEIEELNKFTKSTAKNLHVKDYSLVKEPGEQTLDGVQAVAYGRIRKGVGDDFKRTDRMRLVIKKCTDKAKKMNIVQLSNLANKLSPYMKTSLSDKDITLLLLDVPGMHFGTNVGWPYDKTTGMINGASYVIPANLEANTVKLHQDLFGQENYEASQTVKDISKETEIRRK